MQYPTFPEASGEKEKYSNRLETITVAYSLPDALVMQTTLRAHGIHCFAGGAAAASAYWYLLPALGGIPIQVLSSMKDEALALFPDVTNPRSRAEITAEIKANGGPYARWRLIIAHILKDAALIFSSLYALFELAMSFLNDPLDVLFKMLLTIVNFILMIIGTF